MHLHSIEVVLRGWPVPPGFISIKWWGTSADLNSQGDATHLVNFCRHDCSKCIKMSDLICDKESNIWRLQPAGFDKYQSKHVRCTSPVSLESSSCFELGHFWHVFSFAEVHRLKARTSTSHIPFVAGWLRFVDLMTSVSPRCRALIEPGPRRAIFHTSV